jgi:ABC-type antimicrobial peptide transport system permease subunit
MLGIYALLSYSVGQQKREIGIRMALGADRRQLSGLIVGQAVRLTSVGILLGLGGALVAGRLIARLLFGVEPADPVTLAGTSALMLAAAMLASLAPARRAMRVDPAAMLKSE